MFRLFHTFLIVPLCSHGKLRISSLTSPAPTRGELRARALVHPLEQNTPRGAVLADAAAAAAQGWRIADSDRIRWFQKDQFLVVIVTGT